MAYELVKYEHSDTGLLLPNRPTELYYAWGEIIGVGYNPVRDPIDLVRPKQDHIGLKLRFENKDGLGHKPRLLVQETSDLGHLVEVAGLTRDSIWRDLVGKEVFLHFSKSEEPELYGFTFDYSHEEHRKRNHY